MIAARKRSFSAIDVLYTENMNEKPGEANTRLLICKAKAHQPIRALGDEIIIFAVHGNNKTMKKQWVEAYTRFWNTVKWAIHKFQPHFFLCDFNMALLPAPSELSYYQWKFTGSSSGPYSQKLGLDSCGIFYVQGGDVEARVNWPASHIQRLLGAGNSVGPVTSDWGVELHSYEQYDHADHAPGQVSHGGATDARTKKWSRQAINISKPCCETFCSAVCRKKHGKRRGAEGTRQSIGSDLGKSQCPETLLS